MSRSPPIGEADPQVDERESLSRGDKSVDQGDLVALVVRGGHRWLSHCAGFFDKIQGLFAKYSSLSGYIAF